MRFRQGKWRAIRLDIEPARRRGRKPFQPFVLLARRTSWSQARARPDITYGCLWWGIDYPYKERTLRAFFAGGAGGQALMVIRELGLVIAIYAGNYSSRDAAIQVQQELIPRSILPAVREPGDDPGAPVVPRDYESPYGPSPVSGPVVGPDARGG